MRGGRTTVATFADYLDAGFTGVIPVIPPDAPLSAASKIKPEDRGKVPGRLNGQGTWGGFDWLHHETREADLGWVVLRFTWYDVVRHPAKVAAQVQAVLAGRYDAPVVQSLAT